jgi:hypothetical protein
MGGSAIKSTPIRRYNRAEFDNIAQHMIERLGKHFKNVGVPLFYRNKPDFGDLDILVSTDGFNYRGGMREFIQDEFNPNEIHHNANVWSFDFQEFQIDIITCSSENFQINLDYLSWNDCGNLLGKLAHAAGLKFGQSGLFYRHKDSEGQKLGDIHITRDMQAICEVLDVDYDTWAKGFDTLEEIFEFITSSQYFNKKAVQLDQLDRINRERDKKRKTYMAFIEFCDKKFPDTNDDEGFDKKKIFKDVNKRFPEAKLEINKRKLDYNHARRLYINSKFNGKMVIDEFGFEGKELGDKLNCFREYIEDVFKDYDTFILNNNEDEIMRQFKISCGQS